MLIIVRFQTVKTFLIFENDKGKLNLLKAQILTVAILRILQYTSRGGTNLSETRVQTNLNQIRRQLIYPSNIVSC